AVFRPCPRRHALIFAMSDTGRSNVRGAEALREVLAMLDAGKRDDRLQCVLPMALATKLFSNVSSVTII
ncbi:MAG: hypothetical protein ABUL67_03260, partial [Haliangium ochraceum]